MDGRTIGHVALLHKADWSCVLWARRSTVSAMATRTKLANRVRELRERAGITQSRLAEIAGLSVEAVSRIERGARSPSLETAIELARGLGVAVGDLLSETPLGGLAAPTKPRIARLVCLLEKQDERTVDRVVRIAEIVCER